MLQDTVLTEPKNCSHHKKYKAYHKIICYDCLLVLEDQKAENGYYVESGRRNKRSMSVVRDFPNEWPKQYVKELVRTVREHHATGGRENKILIFFCKKFLAEKYNLSFPVQENLDKIGIRLPNEKTEKKYTNFLK